MNTSQYRDHLRQVHTSYQALVEKDELDRLAEELGRQSWLPSTNGSAPNQVAIEVTDAIMSELYAAATKRDKRAARGALDRLRRLIVLMGTGGPEPSARL